MYSEFGQKRFDDLLSVTGEVSRITNFPSNECKVSVHIGIAIR